MFWFRLREKNKPTTKLLQWVQFLRRLTWIASVCNLIQDWMHKWSLISWHPVSWHDEWGLAPCNHRFYFQCCRQKKCACYWWGMMYNRSSSNFWLQEGMGLWGSDTRKSILLAHAIVSALPSTPHSGRTLASQHRYLWSPLARPLLPFALAEVSHIQALPELLKAAVTRDDLARNRSVTWACWPVSQLLALHGSPQASKVPTQQ